MTQLEEIDHNSIDDHVVEEICEYLTHIPSRSFFLFAGAGSGKTRTLVNVLRNITGVAFHETGEPFSRKLRAKGQSVCVITYTKNAAKVIKGRLGENTLTAVSTIHTFCWELIKGFDDDILEAMIALKNKKLENLKSVALQKESGETDTDRQKYSKVNEEIESIKTVRRFIYYPDQNKFGLGSLNHAEVISVAAWLLVKRVTLQKILRDRHPVILIDESQDTMKEIVDALLLIHGDKTNRITLGFLGDFRQRIYNYGHADLPSLIPDDWAKPVLQMNHRSQKRVVDLINCIWGSDIVGRTKAKQNTYQKERVEKNKGTVRIFIGDSKQPSHYKLNKEKECIESMSRLCENNSWLSEVNGYKTLTLEHKMAAKRGGFYNAFSALCLLDKDASTPNADRTNSGPSMIRALLTVVIEIGQQLSSHNELDEYSLTELLRTQAAYLDMPEGEIERLRKMEFIIEKINDFRTCLSNPDVTVRDVIAPFISGEIIALDKRLIDAYHDDTPCPVAPVGREKEDKEKRLIRGWRALFNTSWKEIILYKDYLTGNTNLSTHQFVKGSEFKNVLVIMDDMDCAGHNFSYEAVFSAVKTSAVSEDGSIEQKEDDGISLNQNEGKNNKSRKKKGTGNGETIIDRTIRLLYVTCSRAEENLALVLWVKDKNKTLKAVHDSGWFEHNEIIPLI